jgi:hypothetical protein
MMKRRFSRQLSAFVTIAVASLQSCSKVDADPTKDRRSAAASPQSDSAAAHNFVQGFYDWYTPLSQRKSPDPARFAVLNAANQYLEASLAKSLREDSLARTSRSRDFLDLDPFLDSDDPCPRYKVTEVRPSGAGFRVRVTPVCPNASWQANQPQRPVVEVLRAGDGWRIANVYYETRSLKGRLCEAAMSDEDVTIRPKSCP